MQLSLIYGILSLALLIAAFFFINRSNKLIISLLTAGAFFIYLMENISPLEMTEAFGTNTNVLSLFLMIPLVGAYMSFTGYLTSLKHYIAEKSAESGNHPYRLSFTLMLCIGFILNFGAMAIIRQIADESFRSFHQKKLTLHLMRGFACCMLWSPYFVNIGLVVAIFDISWFSIGFFGLFLAAVFAGLSTLWLRRIDFSGDVTIENTSRSLKHKVSILPLIRFGILFVSLSFLFYYNADASMIVIVSLLAIFLPIVFALAKKEMGGYLSYVFSDIRHSFLRVKNEMAIFIAAGFFGTAVSSTAAGEVISNSLAVWTSGSVLLFSFIIMLVTLMFALVGVHPIIIIIGIGSSLSPESLGISHEYAALLLVSSWTIATQISPFSGQVLMASRLMDVTPLSVIKQNASFVAAAFVCVGTALYSLYYFQFI
ncbi:hypothetical protein [Alkalicoccus halolimnae]|uniref:Uncharacterized protein n=1 Tax=Alkalicoccus halolimnae TaxID=1667239 RepID=A0A5C7FCN2_9BACI|nr:hypothetical protein [Alkalicoccus halolimnae]TXF87240.1 hypothetical protein FTX54_00510 [Alkalicoccus halolimnae]